MRYGRFGWIALPSGLEMIAHSWIITVSAVMFFAAEFIADKLPGFDLLWNAAHIVFR
jgi:hypothetical protein